MGKRRGLSFYKKKKKISAAVHARVDAHDVHALCKRVGIGVLVLLLVELPDDRGRFGRYVF